MKTKIIKIYEDVNEPEEFVTMLRYVAGLIEAGFSSGYSPTWEIVDHDEMLEVTENK